MNPSKSSNGSLRISPWRDAVTQPPAKRGWYEVQMNGVTTRIRWYWDGKSWGSSFFPLNGDKWRGATQEDAK